MFCKAGFEVCMYDNNLDQLTSAVEGIKVLLNEFHEKGLVNKTFISVDNAMSLVSTSTTLQEAVKGALFVQVYFFYTFILCVSFFVAFFVIINNIN